MSRRDSARPRPLPLACSDPRGSGVPLLLVHGFGHNRAVWEKLMSGLPPWIRPISLDLRGHAESPWSPEGAYDLGCYAADLPALMDRLGIAEAVVVAHSMGGNVATLFAAAHPERVRSLVLVDTGPALETGGMAHVTDEIESALRSYASVGEFRDQLALIHPGGDAEILDRLAATGVALRLDGRFEPALDPGILPSSGEQADMAAITQELWTALGDVRCPVLLVRGAQSAILSEKVAREMVEEVLDDGTLVTLPGAGHGVMIDAGPALVAALERFLAGSGASRPA
jgi:pimeloyl-ACP methyl ester carboxylesterase